jgi:hypothetical protein
MIRIVLRTLERQRKDSQGRTGVESKRTLDGPQQALWLLGQSGLLFKPALAARAGSNDLTGGARAQ